jgi:SAM-dependent methyltransferase
MSENRTPLYARLLLGLVSPFPNFDFWFIKPIRRKAAALLRVSPGARVLDAGCGSGGSFPCLVNAVGPSGQVVGVEISPAAAALAWNRVARNMWTNVEVVVSAAQEVALTGKYDALLMFAAPDVFASKEALDNLLPHLRMGARLAIFGAKTSPRRCGWLLNPLLHLALTRLSFRTTPGLETEPWRMVASHVRDLRVEEYFHGWMFLASGTLNAADAQSVSGPAGHAYAQPGRQDEPIR